MKILLKIAAVIIVLFAALLFILPIVYKGQIVEIAKKELNKNLNANIDFDDIELSLIKNFPDFNVSIESLHIIGKQEFSKDTLLFAESISLKVGLMSVFKQLPEIEMINLVNPQIKIKILENGKANYDIALPESSQTESPAEENQSAYLVDIKKFRISDGQIIYEDKELDLAVEMLEVNHTLSGKLGADNTTLVTNTRINSLNVIYENTPILQNIATVYQANIDADIKNEIYTLGKNKLILNNLGISFEGSVSCIGSDLNTVITFSSLDNKFKDALSLIPAVYTSDFENIETSGNFSVNGFVKGIYNDEQIPSFKISFNANNGMFHFPELPKAVTNIQLTSEISNKGGTADNTIINVSEFKSQLGENKIEANLNIKTPVSDPDISSKLEGKLNLSTIKDYYPIDENSNLSGNLIFDVFLKGKLSALEDEKYNEFVAMGSVLAKNLNYNSPELNHQALIENAQLNFSPEYLDLVSFKASSGKNNLQASGKITNYIPYYFGSGILAGNLKVNSTYLNIDELFTENENTETIETEQSEEILIIDIPDSINFLVTTKINYLVYDGIEMKNVSGTAETKNKTLYLKNLVSDAIDGKLIINGSYSTATAGEPEVDFNIKMKELSIPKAFDQLTIIKNYLPLAKNTTGAFSADFVLNTKLTNQMMPDYESMNGIGNISSSQISINELNTLGQIANTLKISELQQMALNSFKAHFSFVNGKLIVKPTNFSYKGIAANLEGWTAIDQSIGYNLNLDVPLSKFGSNANQIVNDLFSSLNNAAGTSFSTGDKVPVNIIIGGTLTKPTVGTKLAKSQSDNIKDAAKDKVKEEIKKQEEKLRKEIEAKAQKIKSDADKKAKQIMAEAKKQSEAVNKEAQNAINNLNVEANKQAEALITEGKKNGFVAELASKEAAKKLKTEAKKNGNKLKAEARQQSTKIIDKAKIASDKLKKDAEIRANNLVKEFEEK